MFSKMKKLTTAAFMGSLVLGSLISAPAQAQVTIQFGERDRYIETYCDRHGWDRDCRDWRDNRHSWRDRHYRSWYNRHHGGSSDAGIAAGIFGLAIGAIAAGAAASDNDDVNLSNDHIERCQARFRSYDVRTDSYLGYDGERHRCRL